MKGRGDRVRSNLVKGWINIATGISNVAHKTVDTYGLTEGTHDESIIEAKSAA